MFIEQLSLSNVKTFVKDVMDFVNPDREYALKGKERKGVLPRPRLPNVNLLLGDNGSGKSTVLRSIAQVCFGPAAQSAGLRDPGLIRRTNGEAAGDQARLAATLLLH